MPLFLLGFMMSNKPLLSPLTGNNQKAKIKLSELLGVITGMGQMRITPPIFANNLTIKT